jgi:hypothetical protein
MITVIPTCQSMRNHTADSVCAVTIAWQCTSKTCTAASDNGLVLLQLNRVDCSHKHRVCGSLHEHLVSSAQSNVVDTASRWPS